eukprot:6206004-Pleurochrysis_carterae.AAC.2
MWAVAGTALRAKLLAMNAAAGTTAPQNQTARTTVPARFAGRSSTGNATTPVPSFDLNAPGTRTKPDPPPVDVDAEPEVEDLQSGVELESASDCYSDNASFHPSDDHDDICNDHQEDEEQAS